MDNLLVYRSIKLDDIDRTESTSIVLERIIQLFFSNGTVIREMVHLKKKSVSSRKN